MLDKSDIAVLCILGMIGGFLVSRVLLSASMFLFGVNALWGISPQQWLKHKWWLLGMAWVAIYALTWFWSEDKGNWGTRLEVKLPILLLPLAFPLTPGFTPRQITLLTMGMGAFLLGGAGYSIFFLIRDYDFYMKEYSVSHMLRTPAHSDYLRFSLTITLFIIWCFQQWPLLTGSAARWFTALCVLLLTVYIHILASKSGLVSFYLFIACWSLYFTISSRKVVGLLIILAIPVALNFAADHITTLGERKGQILQTIYSFEHNDKSGNYGDLARLISYEIAIKLIQQRPVQGYGSGDLLTTMNTGYDQWYPQVEGRNRLVPHNEFLTVALGCGVPAMLIFCIWVFAPLSRLRRNRQSFFFFAVWLILLVQLMIEPVLEIQYGVFVYILFLLLFRHMLPARTEQVQLVAAA